MFSTEGVPRSAGGRASACGPTQRLIGTGFPYAGVNLSGDRIARRFNLIILGDHGGVRVCAAVRVWIAGRPALGADRLDTAILGLQPTPLHEEQGQHGLPAAGPNPATLPGIAVNHIWSFRVNSFKNVTGSGSLTHLEMLPEG